MTSNLIYDKIRYVNYTTLQLLIQYTPMSALWVDSCATHQAIKLKVLWKELNAELLFELLKLEASKILGKDISSVIFSGDVIQHNLFNCYALTHIMIFYINMFGANFLHRVRPNENAALIICIDRDRT
jgi:hypothetical protein